MSEAVMFFAGWLCGAYAYRKGWGFFRDRLARIVEKVQAWRQ